MLLVSSVVGLLYGLSGHYERSTAVAFVSQDIVTLIIGLPLLVIAMWLARHGSTRGILLWMGTLFYFGYGYAYYVFGVRFNQLYLLYIAIVVACVYTLLWMLFTADSGAFRAKFDIDTPVQLIGGLLIAVALLFVVVFFCAGV
jgi:hypothetical protein